MQMLEIFEANVVDDVLVGELLTGLGSNENECLVVISKVIVRESEAGADLLLLGRILLIRIDHGDDERLLFVLRSDHDRLVFKSSCATIDSFSSVVLVLGSSSDLVTALRCVSTAVRVLLSALLDGDAKAIEHTVQAVSESLRRLHRVLAQQVDVHGATGQRRAQLVVDGKVDLKRERVQLECLTNRNVSA